MQGQRQGQGQGGCNTLPEGLRTMGVEEYESGIGSALRLERRWELGFALRLERRWELGVGLRLEGRSELGNGPLLVSSAAVVYFELL